MDPSEFSPEDVAAAVQRLYADHGPGAIDVARRNAAKYSPETWGGRWWNALKTELDRRYPRTGLVPKGCLTYLVAASGKDPTNP